MTERLMPKTALDATLSAKSKLRRAGRYRLDASLRTPTTRFRLVVSAGSCASDESDRDAAVNDEGLAGDERRIVGEQEFDRPDHVLGSPQPLQGSAAKDLVELFVLEARAHLGSQVPRGN